MEKRTAVQIHLVDAAAVLADAIARINSASTGSGGSEPTEKCAMKEAS